MNEKIIKELIDDIDKYSVLFDRSLNIEFSAILDNTKETLIEMYKNNIEKAYQSGYKQGRFDEKMDQLNESGL